MRKQNKQITKKAILVLSTLQMFMYIWLLYTNYTASHDSNPSDYGWMGGFVPAGLFALFGVINIVFFIVYTVQHFRAKERPQALIVFLGVGLIALYVFLGPLIGFIDSL